MSAPTDEEMHTALRRLQRFTEAARDLGAIATYFGDGRVGSEPTFYLVASSDPAVVAKLRAFYSSLEGEERTGPFTIPPPKRAKRRGS